MISPLTRPQVLATADSIRAVQLRSGCIPSVAGGRADPWNHVECAMGLDVAGYRCDAERAYQWLAATQRANGSWANYYVGDAVDDETLDANACAYVAVGTLHHFVATADGGFLTEMWPVVERAIEVALALQTPGGEILWGRDPRGNAWPKGLVTSNSCIHLSLRCGVVIAELLGLERPDWELSAASLAYAIRHRPFAFEDKDRWSMDWYYPVLGGVVTGDDAHERVSDRWSEFVVEGLGVRCVNDHPWITAAETCELVLTLDAMARRDDASKLLHWVQWLRHDDGGYWTGATFPDTEYFPPECSTWTAAAVLLAHDALTGTTPASGLFRGENLPKRLDLPEVVEDAVE